MFVGFNVNAMVETTIYLTRSFAKHRGDECCRLCYITPKLNIQTRGIILVGSGQRRHDAQLTIQTWNLQMFQKKHYAVSQY